MSALELLAFLATFGIAKLVRRAITIDDARRSWTDAGVQTISSTDVVQLMRRGCPESPSPREPVARPSTRPRRL